MAGVFKGKVFLLVTGASRGIGKHIALNFGSLLESGSHVLLLARNLENLKETAAELPKNLVTSCKSIDFSKTSFTELQAAILESLNGENPANYNQIIIVHNAAMATFSQPTIEMTDFEEWNKCFNLNVFSAAVLNGISMKIFNNPTIKKYIVNISSYWGTKPEMFVGSYCSAKAAKDMYFKVFALENPEVNVLNYLPGLVDTDMFKEASEKMTGPTDAVGNKRIITPLETAICLARVLSKQKYKSGDHVDFYSEQSL